jgi:HD-like signal output (HDOD) protein
MQDFETQAQRFAEAIELELEEGRLTFPTAFDVSTRVQRIADDPTAGLDDIARIVQAEPLLSAKVVRMANSVALNPAGASITSVSDAVRRVGLATLRCLAFAVSAEQLARDHRSRNLRLIASGLWLHSVEVACWSHSLARKLRTGSPDTALFAGMLVDIGQFFLLARAAEFPEMETDMENFARFVATWNEPVAAALLESLDMPHEILDAFDYADPYGGSWPPKGLGDVLFIAGLAAETPNPFQNLLQDNRRELLESATLGIDMEAFNALTASVDSERRSMLSAVCGG